MAKDLERDLGLASVMAISIGAMVGSGIFILPALAMKMAGPSVVLAYLLAGVLVLPAALSKSEMATAMPEAGGTYVYIERSMGPLLGTIAGIGTWFALSFKGALALVGGAPYIVLLFDLPIQPVALGLAALLIGVNLVGVKQTGRIQVGIVVVMLGAMIWFASGSVGGIDPVRFDGLFEKGIGGILAASGFVFVSYAGVTKVASVAEEIENPSRNIPLGMLGSLGFTTALYVIVVAVLVGAAPTPDLAGSTTPVADVAQATLARPGVVAIVLAAILALISTANAGLLSSSRYPFAMSRDQLLPATLEHVSDRFDTPTTAISLTGAMLLVMIAFVPLDDIAKLGSAFQILVFVLINVALVAFRETDTPDFDPDFRDPLYPWSQAVGIVGGLVLLTQMGPVPLVGAILITLTGTAWYFVYARPRVRREGVARDEIRRHVGRRAVERTRTEIDAGSDSRNVVVAVTEETDQPHEAVLIRMAAAVARRRDGGVTVVRFDEVPDQLPLDSAAEMESPGDADFERRMSALSDELSVPLEFGEIVSHDAGHAVVNFVEHNDADLLVLEGEPVGIRSWLLGTDVDWIARHSPVDMLLVDAEDVEDPDEVALVADHGPFDPLKVEIADGLAAETGATVRLVQAVDSNSTDERRRTIERYHDELSALVSAPVESRVVEADDPRSVSEAVADVGLIVVAEDDSPVNRAVDDRQPRMLLEGVDGRSIVVRPHRERPPGALGRLLERMAF